jgi:hypothetical protein
MNDSTIRVIGGIYFALCSALSEQGVDLANDVLFGLAEDPQTEASDAFVYRSIAESASGDSGGTDNSAVRGTRHGFA